MGTMATPHKDPASGIYTYAAAFPKPYSRSSNGAVIGKNPYAHETLQPPVNASPWPMQKAAKPSRPHRLNLRG